MFYQLIPIDFNPETYWRMVSLFVEEGEIIFACKYIRDRMDQERWGNLKLAKDFMDTYFRAETKSGKHVHVAIHSPQELEQFYRAFKAMKDERK